MIDNFPLPIVTSRLLLRQPRVEDAAMYVTAVTESMRELRPWLAWAHSYPTLMQAEEYIRQCYANWQTKDNNNIGLVLWIIDKATRVFLGYLVMWNIVWEESQLDLGFWRRSSYAHRGYVTEAVNALTRYCLVQLGMHRVRICCEKENIQAQLVPQRLGFQLVATLANSTIAVATGKPTDTVVYVCTKVDDLPVLEVQWF